MFLSILAIAFAGLVICNGDIGEMQNQSSFSMESQPDGMLRNV